MEQSSNYEHVEDAILKAYELVPEAYRQKFRNHLNMIVMLNLRGKRGTFLIDGVILRR